MTRYVFFLVILDGNDGCLILYTDGNGMQVALARVLASFKTETTFFDTLSLTYPHALDIPDAENDLERELQL